MGNLDDFLDEYGMIIANYIDKLMEYENVFAQGLQIYYNVLRSDFGQKYKYFPMVEALHVIIQQIWDQFFEISEIQTLLKSLLREVDPIQSAGVYTYYLEEVISRINGFDEMVTLLKQVANKRKNNEELTEREQLMESVFTDKMEYLIRGALNRNRANHEAVLKILKDFIPDERLHWWVEEDTISQFISDSGKIFHDLAVIFTSVVENKPELLNVQGSIAELFRKIKEYMNNPPDNTKMYLSGSVVNIQAGTGHSVKIDINSDKSKIYGHIGDYSFVQNVDVSISNRGDFDDYADKVYKGIDIIAKTVSLEQRIRKNLIGEFDVILEELYSIETIKEIEREAGTHTDTSSLYNELDRVLARIVNLFKRQLLLFNQLNSIIDEPVELLSPVEIIINDQHFRHRIHAIEGFVSYMKEMFKGT